MRSDWSRFLLCSSLLAGCADTTPAGVALPVRTLGALGASSVIARPTDLFFGTVPVGCVREEQLFLDNPGKEDVWLRSPSLDGPDYALTTPDPLDGWLEGGTSLTLELSVQPGAVGATFGELRFEGSLGQPIAEVPLSTLGLEPWTSETFTATGARGLDLMLVVDRSYSMEDDDAALARNASTLADALLEKSLDFHAMVVTGGVGCHVSSILTPSTPNLVESLQQALSSPTGRNTERGLLLAELALERAVEGGCNEGFRRPDAALEILFVTDEPDRSPRPWQDYLASIRQRDPGAVLSAVAGPAPAGCDTALFGAGYYESVSATGGQFLSICDGDWSEHLAALTDGMAQRRGYVLAEPAEPSSLEVRLDGRPIEGWSYEPALDLVLLDTPPAAGSAIEVRYRRSCSLAGEEE